MFTPGNPLYPAHTELQGAEEAPEADGCLTITAHNSVRHLQSQHFKQGLLSQLP